MGENRLTIPLNSIYCPFLKLEGQLKKLGIIMAKSNITLIKLLSTAGTGFYYTKKKNPRTKPEKFRFWKYDPIAGEHVEFEEAKLK